MEGVNLIPAHRQATRRRSRYTRRWGVGVALYAALLAGGWLALQMVFGGADRAMASELGELRMQAADAAEQIRELQPRLADAQTTLAASRSVGSQPDWSLLLSLLSHELDEQTMLNSLRLEPISTTGAVIGQSDDPARQKRFRLRVAGLGRSQAAVSDYVIRLEQTQLFDQVTLIDTRREPLGNDMAVGFRVECELTP